MTASDNARHRDLMAPAGELTADVYATRYDADAWSDAKRVELAWQGCPTLLLVAGDGSKHRHALSPAEAHELASRLVLFLGHLHRTTNEGET